MLPSSSNFSNTSAILVRIRRSGSISHRSPRVLRNPMGSIVWSSPRSAFSRRATRDRWRMTPSSHSLMVPLKAQQQPVVEVVGIVDPFGVDDQRRGQSAQVDQVVPVPVVAGQTRGFEGEHRAHLLQADRGHQALEYGSRNPPGSGSSQILVHHFHLAPAQGARPVRQFVLPALALQVLMHLAERRLADVDVRGSLQVLRRDLGRDHETSSPACEPSRRSRCSPSSWIHSSSTPARTSGERVSHWMQPKPRGQKRLSSIHGRSPDAGTAGSSNSAEEGSPRSIWASRRRPGARRAETETVGDETNSVPLLASICVIHSGTSVLVPSGRTTKQPLWSEVPLERGVAQASMSEAATHLLPTSAGIALAERYQLHDNSPAYR